MGCATALFWGHPPGAQGRVQRSTSVFEKSISKDFSTKLYVCSQKKKNEIFIMSPGSHSRGGTWGCLGSFFFPNMVMWHIKLKGMISRTGYKLNFHRMVELVILMYSQ